MECNCEQLLRANELCDSLNKIMLLINSSLDTDEIMSRIIVETAKGVGCQSARIALREGEGWRKPNS